MLHDWFGDIDFHFHDAEIVELQLKSEGPSRLAIHAWRLTGEIDKAGIHLRDRDALVTFILDDVIDLALEGSSRQNVIARLDLEEQPDSIRIRLAPSYGMGGNIDVRQLSMEVHPFDTQ